MATNKNDIRSKLPGTEPIKLHPVPLDADGQEGMTC
jgi:hypothetical protein